MKFTVVFYTDDSQLDGVTVPDLPGCFSAGDDLDDALASVAKAIDLHVKTLIEEGVDVPLHAPLAQAPGPSRLRRGHLGCGGRSSRKYLGPVEKIKITVPQMVLAHIDDCAKDCAKRHGQSRSGFLVDAARLAMAAQPKGSLAAHRSCTGADPSPTWQGSRRFRGDTWPVPFFTHPRP